MKKMHLLGSSKEALAITFDIMEEIFGATQFLIYPNIDTISIPLMPIKALDYTIMPVGTVPKSSSKVFIATPGPKNKAAIFNDFHQKHNIGKNRYLQVIHPSAYIASSCHIENGVLIEPHVVISSQTTIGFGVFIKRGSLIGHHNDIGAFTDINPGVVLSGNITIGEKCVIGSGAIVKDNISIGANTIIGIGSVVTKNIPANAVAYGNPCKVARENT
ncbi:MAG: acetyltransferase [Maribacter sp.]|uniref:acetyltransferase n=1 Tax=Maribacter sp. TaxID=1897614 RepID=UPI003C75EBA8